MALTIPKTYAANTILTAEDLDNLRTPVTTLVNQTRLDSTLLNLTNISTNFGSSNSGVAFETLASADLNTFWQNSTAAGANKVFAASNSGVASFSESSQSTLQTQLISIATIGSPTSAITPAIELPTSGLWYINFQATVVLILPNQSLSNAGSGTHKIISSLQYAPPGGYEAFISQTVNFPFDTSFNPIIIPPYAANFEGGFGKTARLINSGGFFYNAESPPFTEIRTSGSFVYASPSADNYSVTHQAFLEVQGIKLWDVI